jgi:hypothetical protein
MTLRDEDCHAMATRLIESWPRLPPHIKDAISTLLEAALSQSAHSQHVADDTSTVE